MAARADTPGRRDAVRLAKRMYLAGERVEMNQLAAELSVNRVTLNRWVGKRDDLLLEVVWQLTESLLDELWAEGEDFPGARVPRLVGGLLRAQLSQRGARRFLLEENERAMRLFTHARYGHQPKLVARVRGYLEQDVRSGRTSVPLSLDDLAVATVRIAESYAYLPTTTGQDPDPDGAQRVLEAFLGVRPARPQPPARP